MITTRRAALAAGAAAFSVIAILNCGGYRYGIGDQAFYVPAVVQHLNPDLFPRGRALLHAQDRFMLYDDATAVVSRVTGIAVPWLFFAGYIIGMLLLYGGAVAIGRVMYRSWWAVALLATLLTLRHRITQTGANTLEAYFQPRMIAFALGAWAIASALRGNGTIALGLVAASFAVHPTTALWFAIWIAVMLVVSERQWRRPLLGAGAAGAMMSIWAVTAGPLRGHLNRMDPLWASALSGKDYIFPSDWNASFWLVNLAYLGVAAAIYSVRKRRGVALPGEIGLLSGAAALVCVFLISWPLMAAGVALALQLQTSRVFWMLDLLAAIYIAWLLAEAPRSPAVRRAIVAAAMAVAIARGLFVWRAEHAGNPIVRIGFPQDNWTDAMKWVSQTPPDTHILATPGHAWMYGTSVRVSGERDVYLEDVKDLALALYSREVAVEALQRIHDARSFDTLTADQFRSLASRYDLDYLVVERDVDLPLAYRNDRFRVYRLQ
ncbi:MAG TPA: hypothetical protein VJM31_04505 [Vicinamibacterales bacterium]|nr:hypothetical protein [Vicinamibacterales bacterium]